MSSKCVKIVHYILYYVLQSQHIYIYVKVYLYAPTKTDFYSLNDMS